MPPLERHTWVWNPASPARVRVALAVSTTPGATSRTSTRSTMRMRPPLRAERNAATASAPAAIPDGSTRTPYSPNALASAGRSFAASASS